MRRRSGRHLGLSDLSALGVREVGAACCRARPPWVLGRTFSRRVDEENQALPVPGTRAGPPEVGVRGDRGWSHTRP
ncbi:hypothetical protein NDU88_005540 [Pleurodeles waltl]|uniref:Uncharacterized protein n=1 Tax=Pleurodeles waltl TaxID=8319 RepID=A0AAV7LLG6_PLEWA|nr:hypothetical protein NDU88_005540 [Pleurodeles waltl]